MSVEMTEKEKTLDAKGLYAHVEYIENLAKLAEKNIERLEELIVERQKELKVWHGLLVFSQVCRRLADEEASENKKGQLRYKWAKQNIQGSRVWTSEVGDVCLKVDGKYYGFPKCLEHLRPVAVGDRNSGHMVHRPKKDRFDFNTTDFNILVDCQLAVEEAHENQQKKQKK